MSLPEIRVSHDEAPDRGPYSRWTHIFNAYMSANRALAGDLFWLNEVFAPQQQPFRYDGDLCFTGQVDEAVFDFGEMISERRRCPSRDTIRRCPLHEPSRECPGRVQKV